MNNINQIFSNNTKIYRNNPLFWHKQNDKWISISWENAFEQKEKLSNSLKNLGIRKNDKIAIISQNSPEWCIADLSILSIGAVTVPGYITSTENELEYLLNHSEAKGLFISKSILLKVLKIENKLKHL